MSTLALQFERVLETSGSVDDLVAAMIMLIAELGIQYFALTSHSDDLAAATMRLHNYPDRWADYYEAQSLVTCDPVHRACGRTTRGFRWRRIPELIAFTRDDQRMLDMGREEGIGDGYTVPANVPGEISGSCSFANDVGRPIADEVLPIAQFAGGVAFETARRLWLPRGQFTFGRVQLTDRQRDCLLWIARGKSDWEIARILDIGEETVKTHIRMACERYGVSKRTSLIARTLCDGTLSFTEIYRS